MSISDYVIFLLPGLGFGTNVFSPVVNLLPSGVRCVSCELPGHGAGMTSGYSADADEFCYQLSRLVIRYSARHKPVMMGWSLGASLAMRAAQHVPKDINLSIISIDQSPRMTLSADLQHAAFGTLDDKGVADISYSIRNSGGIFVREFSDHLVKAAHIPSMDRGQRILNPVKINGVIVSELFEVVARWDLLNIVDSPYFSCFYMTGGTSTVYPTELSSYFRDALTHKHNKSVYFPRLSHAMLVEDYRLISDCIKHFLFDCSLEAAWCI